MIVSENGHKLTFDDDGDHIKLTHADGPEITLSADEIVLSCGNCELKISSTSISINDGQIKIGQQGVSLVNGSMSFGVAP
jgi:hypothetical protein